MKKETPQYWIFKTEPSAYSIDDLKKDQRTEWYGVRNYQVRNFLRDALHPGDLLLIYHSNTKEIGIVGIAKVISGPLPDSEQFRKGSDYYDPKSTKENPRWISREIQFQKKFQRTVTLSELRKEKSLGSLALLQPGSRLSITPVTEKEFQIILSLEGGM